MGLFSFLGGLFGASGDRKAIQGATDAANQGLQQGINNTQAQQTANTNLFNPYTSAGANATDALQSLLGTGGTGSQADAIASLQQSPLYQSLFNVGNNTILQDASATGGLRGGNTQHNLAGFASGLLGNTIQSQIANLMGVSNQGLNAAQGLAGDNSNLSGLISQLYGDQGANSAQGILGKHNVTAQANQGLFNYLDGTGSSGNSIGQQIGSAATGSGADFSSLLASLF